MMRAIDHIGLTVADLDRAVEFWCGRLGLRLLHRATETDPDIAALLGEDSVELEIADLDAGDGRIIELIRYTRPAGRPVQARSSDPGSSHIALRVDDLDAALKRLEGSQARQISRRAHSPWTVSSVVCDQCEPLRWERISRAHGRRHRAAQWTQVSRLAGKAVAARLVAGVATGLLAR